jgi:multicomponent Na+:H+ antiporter subunit F
MVSDALLVAAAAVLLVALAIGMIRVLRGPAAGDRMLAAQLVGTTGVGILLLLAVALGVPALVDVALVLGLLAAVAVVAFTRREGAQADD